MKKISVVVLLCIFSIIAYGCAGNKIQTLKDIDCLISNERNNPKYENSKVYVRVSRPEPTTNAMDVVHMAISPVGGTLKALSIKPIRNAKHLIINGTISANKYVLFYRTAKDTPTKDIQSEAIEIAGEIPTAECCILRGVQIKPSSIYTQEFKDDNNHIISTKYVHYNVVFDVKKEFKGPLKIEDCQPFIDYANNVGNSMKLIFERDFKTPYQYCTQQ